jgi:hypothetical protein
MQEKMIIQGRTITSSDIELISRLIADNPDWHRTRVSKELCRIWDWRYAGGQIKDMACRSLLLKLERGGCIQLPASRIASGGSLRSPIAAISHNSDPICGDLNALAPVIVAPVKRAELPLFKHLLSRYHYLGYSGTVGRNVKYMVFDSAGNPLACLLFGSSAWKSAARDNYIGWSAAAREANINLTTNNTRFLILPWVRAPHLASHILGQVARRIGADWLEKYGHPVHLLETFVEKERFAGTCYKAANWVCVGETTGRSRNDRHYTLKAPVKDIYLYPLTRNWSKVLRHEV